MERGGNNSVSGCPLLGTDAFDQQPTDEINAGLRDFAGVKFVDAVGSTTHLRDNAVVAVTIAGDITDDIECAQVFRIDAMTQGPPVHGGRILGDITTHRPNFSVVTDREAINYIRAADEIVGDITALNPAFTQGDEGTYADILRIVVGPLSTADGIKGDILAEKGKIGSIFSTGTIGTSATALSKIWAADGIDEIRVVSETDLDAVLDKDLFVDVQSGKAPPLSSGFTGSAQGLEPQEDGSLKRLETGGDLRGVVHVTNLATSWDNPIHSGILVRGDILAPITVDYMMNYADIIGRSITQPVVIGQQLKGAIIAFGTPDPQNPNDPAGTIHSVRVGLDSPDGTTVFGSGAPSEPYPHFRHAHIGTATAPIDMDPGSIGGGMIPIWFPEEGRDGGTLDSLIRAKVSIGSVELAEMTIRHPTGAKPSRPRVESPSIGTLRVHGLIEAGLLWSGKLEYSESEVANDIENDYADVGELQVSCLSHDADLWFTSADAMVDGDVRGEIHLLRSEVGDLLWIGERLVNSALVCDDPFLFTLLAEYVDEESPRGRRTADNFQYRPPVGSIFILEQEGLAGQIILNGTNTVTSGGWDGVVMIGADQHVTPLPSGTIVLSPNESQPSLAPYYDRLPAELGGGAVGLAPFHVHIQASIQADEWNSPPEYPMILSARRFDTSATNCYVEFPVQIEFYGPIEVGIEELPVEFAAAVTMLDPTNPCTSFGGVNTLFTFQHRPTYKGGRVLEVGGSRPNPAKIGPHKVYEAEEGALVSKHVLNEPRSVVFPPDECTTAEPPVPGFVFTVWPDCEHDCDPDDPTTCDKVECFCDANESGFVDATDIFIFLDAWFAQNGQSGPNLSADVNDSGNVDATDIFIYLDCWFSYNGDPCT